MIRKLSISTYITFNLILPIQNQYNLYNITLFLNRLLNANWFTLLKID